MDKKTYHREYMRKRRAGKKTAKENGLSHLIETLEWKDIPGFPGYQVSKCGQVKSCERVVQRDNGRLHTTPEKVLKQSKDTKGYSQVNIYVNKKRTTKAVHKLVYLAWVGEIPEGHEIDHDDTNHQNNHADNLQALTTSEHRKKTYQQQYDKGYRDGYEEGYEQARRDLAQLETLKE